MQIILLTHEREVSRPTNTGQIALKCFPQYCQRIVWARTTPDAVLLEKLQQPDCALLFPEDMVAENKNFAELHHTNNDVSKVGRLGEMDTSDAIKALPSTLVILDATWQEARKMLRRSAYLKEAKKYALTATHDSQFKLRRNQVEGGLCTIECIMELFKQAKMTSQAEALAAEFAHMLDK
ncbi:DTW domain-containing protein [Shewanella sp. KX20019]|uniref:tRNA-uridine aminocarboxypropyltransferase n=1 Tax=Shewanella sp. KX20019 TaxID=2803864 RepID=UPI00192885D7|nr:tRNA-uridine aminocarboxypropyltransferase [Shewanella sp. KX20019]QQX78428.1 DTW domain-containing protein [Shewanella sp. KX20019]